MKNFNQTIKVTANQNKRTFTIRMYDNGKLYVKYRTHQMNQSEFDIEEMNTDNDWKQFLTTDDYYIV